MKVQFLLDENLPPRIKLAVERLNPAIDILRVGDLGTPTLSTPDPEVLRYLELLSTNTNYRQPQKYARASGSVLG